MNQIKNDLTKEITLLHTPTLYWLIKQNIDAYILYGFYCYTASWQQEHAIKATTYFVCKALKWGEKRFFEAKGFLKKANIIEDVVRRNSQGKVVGNYILVRKIDIPSTTLIHQYQISPVPDTSSTNASEEILKGGVGENSNLLDLESKFEKQRQKKVKKQSLPFQGSKRIPRVKGSLKPLERRDLIDVALEFKVPFKEVEKTYHDVWVEIEDGSEKITDTKRTLQKWISYRISKGKVPVLTTDLEVSMEILDYTDEALEKTKRRQQQLKDMGLL